VIKHYNLLASWMIFHGDERAEGDRDGPMVWSVRDCASLPRHDGVCAAESLGGKADVVKPSGGTGAGLRRFAGRA
jgi:hypothetical protein